MESTDLEELKMRLLLKKLTAFQGNGTSLITIHISAGSQLSQMTHKLTEEQGTASNIKSRVNRLSVLTAIATAQQKLKMYTRTPPNGLSLFCGMATGTDGKERKISISFEPPKALASSTYLCDSRFHLGPLEHMERKDKIFGFIVLDGNGALYATICGSVKTILHQFSVELPKKHGRGGQSAVRFGRLRLEARHNYLKKVSEIATRTFISNDAPTVDGLILAGSAEFKNTLNDSAVFDPRLKAVVLSMVDIAYGGEIGLNQAVELSKEILQNVKYVEERKILSLFFTSISRDANTYVFGKKETLKLLKQGVIDKLIVWEGLPDKPEEEDPECDTLLEWFLYHAKDYGTTLITLTNSTPEGTQFEKGFGGIGGILRYALVMDDQEYDEEADFI